MKFITRTLLLLCWILASQNFLRADLYYFNSTTTVARVSYTEEQVIETQGWMWTSWITIYTESTMASSFWRVQPGQTLSYSDVDQDLLLENNGYHRKVLKKLKFTLEDVWNPGEGGETEPPIINPDDEPPVYNDDVKAVYILESSSGNRLVSSYQNGGGDTLTITLGETVSIQSRIWSNKGYIQSHEFGTDADINNGANPKSQHYRYHYTSLPSADVKDSTFTIEFTPTAVGTYTFDTVGTATKPPELPQSWPVYWFPVTIQVNAP